MFCLFWFAVNPWPAALHPRAPPRMRRHSMEAIANVCIFDIMSLVYVPLACFENAIYAETVSPKSPRLPASSLEEPILQDENELSQYGSIWTTQGWHVAHCLYTWRVGTRGRARVAAGEKGVYVVEEATSKAHVNHCNMLVLNHGAAEGVPVD